MTGFFNHLPQFWTGAIAAVLAISALLVLYFLKLRRKEMPVSSTILWRKAVQDLQVNAPFQKLRRNLLLLLQLLILIALCLALMRPVVNFKQGAGKLTVILIDRSASMAAKDMKDGKLSRLEAAKERANEIVDSMKKGDNVCVIAFDESAETLCPLTPDAIKARNAINAIEQTDRKSRLKLAYQLAEAQSSFIPEQNRANIKPDVFLLSDMRTLDAMNLSLRANLIAEKMGDEKSGNIAIVAMAAKRNYERPTEVQVFARLANYGPDVVDADVELQVATDFTGTPNFEKKAAASTVIYPDRWDEKQRKEYEQRRPDHLAKDSVEFKLDLLTSAVMRLEQTNKKNDLLAADNVAQVVVPPPKQLSILLVTDGNYYLEKLRGSMGNKDFDVLTPPAYEKLAADPVFKYDVVIFDQYKPKWMPAVGNFMYFRAVPDQIKIKHVMDGIKPLYTDENLILDWKRDHGMLRGLNLSKLYVAQAMRLQVPLGGERLIEGSKGPLAVISREGRSTHLVIGFDLMQSNWPLKLSFPVFMYNAMQYLALGSEMDVREALPPGATPEISLADVRKVAPDLKTITVKGPQRTRRVNVPETGDFVLPAMDHVGLYTLDPAIPGFDKFAVNLLDASESNLMPAEHVPGGVPGEVRSASGKSRMELWWWLVACLALPLLLIEWFVYTRRVHL